MTLEKLQSEMIQAMKNKNKFRKQVISDMIAAIKKTAIDKKCKDNITESMVDEVLLKHKKIVQEMIDTCPADRTDTLEEYKQQMAIVLEFAPTLITDEAEIEKLVLNLTGGIRFIKANRGAIMRIISANLKGKVDMATVKKVVGGLMEDNE